jgi:hypothetical protein
MSFGLSWLRFLNQEGAHAHKVGLDNAVQGSFSWFVCIGCIFPPRALAFLVYTPVLAFV